MNTVKYISKKKSSQIRSTPRSILPPLQNLRPPVDRMRLLRGFVVFLVDLDRLVRLGRDESRSGHVERHRKDARLAVHRAGLDGGLESLEVVPGAPVPEEHGPVVASGHEHTLRVDGHRVNDRIVAVQVLDEVALGAAPLLDVVRRGRREHVQRRMEHNAADALFVIGQRAHAFTGGQVPQANRRVVASGDDLRVGGLADHAGHRVGVSSQGVNVGLGAHVPDASGGVTTRRHEDIDRGVQGHRVDRRQVAVIMPNDLVVLQIPALDLSILAAAEQVRMPGTHAQPTNRADVTRQGQLQLAACQVPNLNDPIGGTRGKPLVARFHRHAANPTQVTGNDAIQLPRGVPLGLRNCRSLLRQDLNRVGG